MHKTLTENFANKIAQEEKILIWEKVLKSLRDNFGKDVYESWMKNINLNKEYNHYVILLAPTRFVRDWIVSRYADKILDIIKIYKPSIQRIEFLIEEKENDNEGKELPKSNKIAPIENSLLNYNRFNLNNSFKNFVVGESNELAFMAAK